MWLGVLIFVVGAIATYWAYRQYDFRYDKVFFCDGVADEVQINAAIKYAHEVYLRDSVFNVESTIDLSSNDTLLTGTEPPFRRPPCVLVRRLATRVNENDQV